MSKLVNRIHTGGHGIGNGTGDCGTSLVHPNLETGTFSQKERKVHCVQNAESGGGLQRIMGMME